MTRTVLAQRMLVALGLVLLAGCGSQPTKGGPSVAAPAPNLSDSELRKMFCPDGGCRENHVVKLRKPDGSTFVQGPQLNYPPVQQGGWVTIFPSEAFEFTGKFVDGELDERRLVTAADGPVPRISVKFSQQDDGSMMLVIKSTFDQPIKYTLGMMRLDDEMPVHTSTCPLNPNMPVYEMWPHPIYQLFVTSVKPLAPSAKMTCE